MINIPSFTHCGVFNTYSNKKNIPMNIISEKNNIFLPSLCKVIALNYMNSNEVLFTSNSIKKSADLLRF